MATPTDSTTLREQYGDQQTESELAHALELRVVHARVASEVDRSLPLLPQRSAVIGRRPGLELSVEDERVSRSHVRIVWDPRVHAHRFADLGSANGTHLNGQRCESGILSRNDVLRVGDSLLVCVSPGAQRDFEGEVTRVAHCILPVLLLGETGVGKEVLARSIHEQSGRRGAFVPVNCAALPRELAAAELFGHTRGAFSGAGTARDGLVRASDGGTLFLDEIGDLPKDLQPALLRCLEERKVRAIGADREQEVDLRVIAATNADLEAMVARGEFREDLLARLAHVELRLAPLRQRRGEILTLAKLFAPGLEFTTNAAEHLLLFGWPRNVRQLRSVVESLAVIKPVGARIHAADLSERVPAMGRGAPSLAPSTRDSAVGDRCLQLSELLEKHSGNVAGVARELGKPRSHVYRWMRAFRLSRSSFKV